MKTLEAVAARLEYAAFLPGMSGVRGRRRGLAVTFRYVARAVAGGDDEAARATWTEVVVVMAVPAWLLLELRPESVRERRWVRAGLAVDVRVGDVPFDRAYVVDGAPEATVRELLDPGWRRQLVDRAPLVVRCDGPEVTIARPGWFIEEEEGLGLLELTLDLAEAVPAAQRRVERAAPASGNPYRDAPVQDDPVARAARLEELAALVAMRGRRG